MTTVRPLHANHGGTAALIVGHVLGRAYLFALSTAIALAASTTASAHRLDEYLQAARIDLQADARSGAKRIAGPPQRAPSR